MNHIEKYQIDAGWSELSNALNFEVIDLKCPECEEPLKWYYKNDNGRVYYKQQCLNCGHMRQLPQNKNAKRRTNSTLNHWADEVKALGNQTCYLCGHQGKDIEAHHIIPVAFSERVLKYRNYKYELRNGICLCKKCHLMVHGQINEYVDLCKKEEEDE